MYWIIDWIGKSLPSFNRLVPVVAALMDIMLRLAEEENPSSVSLWNILTSCVSYWVLFKRVVWFGLLESKPVGQFCCLLWPLNCLWFFWERRKRIGMCWVIACVCFSFFEPWSVVVRPYSELLHCSSGGVQTPNSVTLNPAVDQLNRTARKYNKMQN